MGNEIRSRLWKSSLLADSRVFVRLVKAACAAQQIPYSDDVLLAASTNRQIVDAVGITKNGNADDVLAELSLWSAGHYVTPIGLVLKYVISTYQQKQHLKTA